MVVVTCEVEEMEFTYLSERGHKNINELIWIFGIILEF